MSPSDNRTIFKHAIERINSNWQQFQDKRQDRLAQQHRHGTAPEKVAENIVEDLLTGVLDWDLSCINNQLKYADIVVSQLGIKYLVVETKAPLSLSRNTHALNRALDQAARYATEQRVRTVAVSDGYLFYAANINAGGLQGRVCASLHSPTPDQSLWYVTVHGIGQEAPAVGLTIDDPPCVTHNVGTKAGTASNALRDSKFNRPADCFAYIGDRTKPATWRLPYLNEDGTPDKARLPKAIQVILDNFRGVRVKTVPEEAIPDVLVRLGRAAVAAGRMPFQGGSPAKAYVLLEEALYQLGRLDEIRN